MQKWVPVRGLQTVHFSAQTSRSVKPGPGWPFHQNRHPLYCVIRIASIRSVYVLGKACVLGFLTMPFFVFVLHYFTRTRATTRRFAAQKLLGYKRIETRSFRIYSFCRRYVSGKSEKKGKESKSSLVTYGKGCVLVTCLRHVCVCGWVWVIIQAGPPDPSLS